MPSATNFFTYLNTLTPITKPDYEASLLSFKELKLQKGDYFVKAGQVCNQVAFISSGILRTFYNNEKAEDITYCFCVENNFTTSFKSFTTQTVSSLSIQAIEDTELLVINHTDLQTLYSKIPVWQTIGRILVEKEYVVVENHALSLNSETAKEKYLRLLKEQPAVIQKAPVQHIASYLGISRETLSRIRNQVTA